MNNPSGINVVVVTKDSGLRNALALAIEEVSGIAPEMKSESQSAQRLHYAPAVSKLILNTAAAEMHDKLGPHAVVLAVEVADQLAAAKIAQSVFLEEGFQSEIHQQAEPEFPKDFLVFLTVGEMEQICLMFWPRPEDLTPDIMASLPKREAWASTDYDEFV